MKALIIAAAVALAFPALAQKSDTTMPNSQERAQNRERVSGAAASATLTTKVKSALAADVGLKTLTGIDVDSDDGVVTLKGKVTSADHKKRAGEVAKQVSGVKRVKNELRVETKG